MKPCSYLINLGRSRPVATSFLAACFVSVAPSLNAAGSWTALSDPRISRDVYALAVTDSGDLYAGGFFFSSPAKPNNFSRLARWDGTTWSQLGQGRTNGVDYTVTELLSDGTRVVVGGEFGSAYIGETGYGINLQGIGRWTGSDWQPFTMGGATGVRGTVHALASSGANLYVGGQFLDAGSAPSTNVVRWDGQQWVSLGRGLGDFQTERVMALAVGPDDSLYAGGTFQPGPNCPARRLARWDGKAWSEVGGGVDGTVHALAFYQGALIVGGEFLEAGGNPVPKLARWDGTRWTSLGGGVRGGDVYALTVHAGALYAGGSFADAGTVAANGLARWDGFQWVGLGGGVGGFNNPAVYAIAATNNRVYVGGHFESAGGILSPYVARWDEDMVTPSNRPPLVVIESPAAGSVQTVPGVIPIRINAADPDGTVSRVDVFTNGVLFASLSSAPYLVGWPNPAPGLYRVSASAVDDLGTSTSTTNEIAIYNASGPPPSQVTPADQPAPQLWAPDGEVFSAIESGGTIYLGGAFSRVGRVVPGGAMADLSGAEPDLEYPPTDGTVAALVGDGAGGFFIGGIFRTVGGMPRTNLAHIRADRTVDSDWKASTVGAVHTLLRVQGTLYIGGEFSSVNNEPRLRAAALDVVSGRLLAWAPAANSYVFDLAELNGVLYLAGSFTSINDQTRQRLAAVDAVTGQLRDWQFDADDNVRSLVLADGRLYAGGAFTVLGGSTRLRLAAIDLVSGVLDSWNPGTDGEVLALARDGGLLYVGGAFSRLGGITAGPVGAVDTLSGAVQAWRPAVNDRVEGLAVLGDRIYLSGTFSEVDGRPRSRVALFNKSDGLLSPIDLSPVGPVSALETVDDRVFVTGLFRLITPVSRRNLAALDALTGRVTEWNVQGSGQIHALAVHGQNLYVAGAYSSLGGQPRSNLGAVDLQTGLVAAWEPVIGTVLSMAVNETTLYLGGDFQQAEGQPRQRLAAYDLESGRLLSWNPGANDSVRVLVCAESQVFVGGMFTRLSGASRSYVGCVRADSGAVTAWDATSDGPVLAFAPDLANRLIYVGGAFQNIGGRKRDHLAALDFETGGATPWAAFVNGTVQAIMLGAKVVYIGGQFEQVGGIERLNVAALDPRIQEPNLLAWQPNPVIPDGTTLIRSLWVTPSRVYIGGRFLNVSRETRQYFAGFDLPARLDSPEWLPDGVFQARLVGQMASTNVFETSTNLVNWIPVSTNTAPGTLRDPQAAGTPSRFYRTVLRQ